MIKEHLNKDNLHHAYLIEGVREVVVPEIVAFVESLGVATIGNPDFSYISFDSVKVDEARNLKSQGSEKPFSIGKKVFIISANSLVLEAQNTLLKMFEEPIENTHFFLVVPDTNMLLKTLVSRFYVIRSAGDIPLAEAERFIKMPLQKRIDFIKELLVEPEDDLPAQAGEVILIDSARPKAIKFLNAIEAVLHKKLLNVPASCFTQIFKIREFLRMPGSSTKNLMESVALTIPVIQ
jgi:hypothetical protein